MFTSWRGVIDNALSSAHVLIFKKMHTGVMAGARACRRWLWVLLLAALAGHAGAERCPNDGYLQCAVQLVGCCGEGYEYRHGLCKTCPAGQQKAKKPYDRYVNDQLTHGCSYCEAGKYQDKTGCAHCADCPHPRQTCGFADLVKTKNKGKGATTCCDDKSYCNPTYMEELNICLPCITPDTCIDKTLYAHHSWLATGQLLPSHTPYCVPQREHPNAFDARDSRRVTFSMAPHAWKSYYDSPPQDPMLSCTQNQKVPLLPKDQDFDENCKHVQCDGPSPECLLNKNSVSWPVCTILNTCMDLHTLEGDWRRQWHAVDSTDDMYILRMPSGPAMVMTFYSSISYEGQCVNRAKGGSPIRLDGPVFTINTKDIPFRYAKISLTMPNSDHDGCKCTPAQGVVMGVESLQNGFVTQCKACAQGQRTVQVPESCVETTRQCEWCEPNHHRNPSNPDAACVKCDDRTPYRRKEDPECRGCYYFEYWDDYNEKCNLLANISVVLTLSGGSYTRSINQIRDQYKQRQHGEALAIPLHHFRQTETYQNTFVYTVQNCNEKAQEICADWQYLHACIGFVSAADPIFYVRYLENTSLWSDFMSSDISVSSDTVDIEVQRVGQCQDCRMCVNGEYLDGCMETSEATFTPSSTYRNGPHEDNQGRCVSCLDPDSTDNPVGDDQYLYHPQFPHFRESACKLWPEVKVTRDYIIKSCTRIAVMNTPTQYMLLAGCGRQEFRFWDVSRDYNTATRIIPKTKVCAYTNKACSIPSEDEGHEGYETLTWSQYSPSTATLPYCPPGWYVNDECARTALTNDAWNPDCCYLCGDCDESVSRRSQTWTTCSGMHTEDTQANNCQASCDTGYYHDTEDNTCRPCETCTTFLGA